MQAAISVVAAMTLIGLIDNTVIYIAEVASLWQFHFIRAIMAVVIIVLVGLITKNSFRPISVWAVGLRAFLFSLSMLLYFGALAFLSVPETVAGLFTAPIFVLLISAFALGKRVTKANIIAVFFGFCGVLMVLQPDVTAFTWAKLMPVAAGLLYAFVAIVTRQYCKEETTLALLLGFFIALLVWGALGCLFLSIWPMPAPDGADGFLLRGWQPITTTFMIWTSVQAVGSVIAVGLLTRGYLLAEAPFVAVFEYSILIAAAFWGWLIWGQSLSSLAALGIGMILLSGVVLARAERTKPIEPTPQNA